VWSISTGVATTSTTGQGLRIKTSKLDLSIRAYQLDATLDTDGVIVIDFGNKNRIKFDASNSRVSYWVGSVTSTEELRCTASGAWDVSLIVGDPNTLGNGTVAVSVNGADLFGDKYYGNAFVNPSIYLESGSYGTIDDLELWEHGDREYIDLFGPDYQLHSCPDNTACSWFPVSLQDEVTLDISGVADTILCPDKSNVNGTYVMSRITDLASDCFDQKDNFPFGLEAPYCGYESVTGSYGCSATKLLLFFGFQTGVFDTISRPVIRIVGTNSACSTQYWILDKVYAVNTEGSAYADNGRPCGTTLGPVSVSGATVEVSY
jgi:hypothetical protein